MASYPNTSGQRATGAVSHAGAKALRAARARFGAAPCGAETGGGHPSRRGGAAARLLGAAMAALLAWSPPARAADPVDPAVDLSARVTPTTVTVGDPVRYEITVTHPAGTRAALPAVRGNTGSLEVLDHTVTHDSTADGRVTATHALTLAAYAVGSDTLPPQRVEVRSGTDTATLVLYTPATVVTVKTTTPPDARDIADIHDGDRMPRAFPWWIALALALVAAATWGFRAWRARRPAPAPPPARVATPAETALARLDTLAGDGFGTPGAARAFAFALSEILREYLAGHYGIDALEATTSELLERAVATGLTPAERAWLRAACEELDGVKFADMTLVAEAAARLLEETRTVVRESWARREDHTHPPAPPEGTHA